MGFVVGTFTYCLVVLQSVRSAVSDNGEDVVPNLSVVVALVLGVASVLAIVAFISHNAHTMEVSEVLEGVTERTIEAFETHWADPADAPAPLPEPDLDTDGFAVCFDDTGWVQHLDLAALTALTGSGGVVRLETDVGRYAIGGVRLCTIWPHPTDPDEVTAHARAAVRLGRTRTMSQDPAYGIRQVADVGIRALSAGIDDPTTAQDSIFHIAAALRAAQRRVPPPAVIVDDDRCLVRTERTDQVDLVELGFEELRRSAASHPTVSIYLLEALSLLCDADDSPAPDDARDAMLRVARDVVAATEHERVLAADATLVTAAYESRFGEL